MTVGPNTSAGSTAFDRAANDPLNHAGAGATAAGGGLFRVGTQMLALALVLVSTPFVIRHLGPEQFGRYATVVALLMIVGGVSEFGLSTVGVREWVQRDEAGRRLLFAELLGARLVVSLAASVFAVGFAAVAGYDPVIVLAVGIGLIGVTLNAVMSALSVPLLASLRQGAIGLAELAGVASQVALQLSLVLAGVGVVPLIAAMVPASLVGVTIVFLLVKHQAVAPTFNLRRVGRRLRESLVFAAASAASVVYLRSTMLIVPLVVSAGAAGQFAIGFRAIESLALLPQMLVGALYPVLAYAALNDRGRLAAGYDLLHRSTGAMGAFSASCVIGASPFAVLLLSGTRNAIAIDTLVILGCAFGTIFVGTTAMWMLLAESNYRAVLKINLVALVGNIVLTIAAASYLGARWAGLGVLVCELWIAIAASRAARGRLAADLSRSHLRHSLSLSAAMSATVAVFWLTRDVGLFVPMVACPLAAGAVLVLTRAVPPELLGLAASRTQLILGRLRGATPADTP